MKVRSCLGVKGVTREPVSSEIDFALRQPKPTSGRLVLALLGGEHEDMDPRRRAQCQAPAARGPRVAAACPSPCSRPPVRFPCRTSSSTPKKPVWIRRNWRYSPPCHGPPQAVPTRVQAARPCGVTAVSPPLGSAPRTLQGGRGRPRARARLTSGPSPAESRGSHVHGAEALQRHDERRAAAGIRRTLLLPVSLAPGHRRCPVRRTLCLHA